MCGACEEAALLMAGCRQTTCHTHLCERVSKQHDLRPGHGGRGAVGAGRGGCSGYRTSGSHAVYWLLVSRRPATDRLVEQQSELQPAAEPVHQPTCTEGSGGLAGGVARPGCSWYVPDRPARCGLNQVNRPELGPLGFLISARFTPNSRGT